jgi:hypothetical protein
MRQFYIQLILLCILVGCSSQTIDVMEPTNEGVVTLTNTISWTDRNHTATRTPAPTPSLTATTTPTTTPTITLTIAPQTFIASPTPGSQINYQCFETMEGLPDEMSLEGTMVIFRYPREYFLYQGGTGNLLSINQDDQSISPIISPNGMWFAYQTHGPGTGEREVIVARADGEPNLIIPMENDWGVLLHWLDDQNLIMTRLDFPIPFVDSIIILNPFTGERRDFSPDYPDLYYDPVPSPLWGEDLLLTRTVYDPTLSRVVYPKGYFPATAVLWNHLPAAVVLWSLETNEVLAYFEDDDYWGQFPKWSRDGDQLAIIGIDFSQTEIKQELFIVSRDGEKRQLTNLAGAYSGARISDYSWSPDGRSIAFWVDRIEYSSRIGYYLMVIDVATGEMTNYCVFGGSEHTRPEAPIWSPSGEQLAVEYMRDDGSAAINVVDLIDGYAARILEDYRLLGWMTSP